MINLRLLQISDSALPVGGYTHSWGLEAAIARRLVHDAASLENWTRDWLRLSLGPLEGVVVACACRAAGLQAWPTIVRANDLLTASLAPPSIRAASQEMGEQLLALARPGSGAPWKLASLRAVGCSQSWGWAQVAPRRRLRNARRLRAEAAPSRLSPPTSTRSSMG